MSISQERFMQFADLALAAFNSKNETIKVQGEQIVDLSQKLAEALANDKADADKIVQAEADAEQARTALADSVAKSEKENQDLIEAINALQDRLGISTPAPTPDEPTPVEPPVEEVPAA